MSISTGWQAIGAAGMVLVSIARLSATDPPIALRGADRPAHKVGTYGTSAVASDFLVRELPGMCTIAINGALADWLTPACANTDMTWPLKFNNGTLNATVRMYTTHEKWPSTNPDVLYAMVTINGAGSSESSDAVVLMFDPQNTPSNTADDVGFCFTRNPKTSTKAMSATAACTGADVLGLTCGQWCITSDVTLGQWNVELKLFPSDLGLTSFGGSTGNLIRVRDGSGLAAEGPGTATSSPLVWANLTLGIAVDVALVLDFSGSMGDVIPCLTSPCVACPAPCHRVAVLKNAAKSFVEAYKVFAWKADRITVRYFRTTVSSFPNLGNLVNLLDTCTALCADDIKNDIQGQSENNMTALGPGLLSAINTLTTNAKPGRKVHIVLFSDGMQNVAPFVDSIIPDTSPDNHPSADLVISGTRLDGVISRIHTLGIDGTSAYMAMMASIAEETGGTNRLTTDAANNMTEAFLTDLDNVLLTHSPQLVAYRRGALSADSAVEAFTVNDGVKRIVLQLSRPPGTRLSFRVRKDGIDVTESGHTITEDSYQMFILDLPAHAGPNDVTAGGRWDLLIQGPSGTPYQAAAIVDEPRLTYDVSAGRASYAVGETIQLTAEIALGGRPIDDAAVMATVGRPGQGIGTLLSVNLTPTAPPQNQPEPAATPGQKKFRLLLEDEKLWRTIQPSGRTVRLTSAGGGKYSGTFTATEVEGQYPVTFQVDGSNPEIGTYQRTRTVTVLARFAAADFGASDVRARTIDRTPAGRQVILHLRPRDRFGNYLGPDFADRIHVTMDGAPVGASKQDLLDGGYDIPLLVPPGSDPEVTIDVVGHRLFKGPLSALEEGVTPAFTASLHAGVSVPHGSFGTSLNTGFGITADLAYHLPGRPVDLELLAGYHRFGGAGASPDVKLFHLSGSGKLFLTQGRRAAYVEAGIGAYDFSPGPTDAGVHAGAGVQFNLWPRAALEGLYRLHRVFTSGSNSTFSSIQVGGRVRF